MISPLFAYNDIRLGLESIFRSRLQMQILLSLGEGCKTLSDLRTITGSSSQAIIPRIRALEKRSFISAQKYQYCLTPLGRIFEAKINEITRLFSLLTNHDTFWQEHYLEGIPEQSIKEMSDLYNSQIIADTSVEIFQVYAHYQTAIEKAKRIHWISSMISPGHLQYVISQVIEGVPVEMIITAEVEMQLRAEPYASQLSQMRACSNYIQYISDNPLKFGLMVTDTELILGLYKQDMTTFDASSHFTSHDSQALSWGERVFTHFRSTSRACSL
ncbi:MAG TPA: transcriptional regulator FilR1 domain-containing protein [Methanospirillum sp.]|uniref:helix-turn-helix transcriptional regulator n=1 Tax=Methanospirillum sp. TaxID=45200 RepID=UPI002D1E1BED|nr:transcriptional regulator FilR1 domain-containing protein [Methanospirillum sp.]HWQ64017.1 transcriptional regulator FilR1 domain-containing protein [Methanospirillum sp.]